MTGTLSAVGCDQGTKHCREELPHVPGQGQKPGGSHARRVEAKRSYPTWSGAAAESARLRQCRNGQEELPKSEVRGGGQEELPYFRGQGQRLRGATLSPRPGAAARRSNPKPEARGSGREV